MLTVLGVILQFLCLVLRYCNLVNIRCIVRFMAIMINNATQTTHTNMISVTELSDKLIVGSLQ